MKEYKLQNPPIDSKVHSRSGESTIRNITFNHDTIAALVETMDNDSSLSVDAMPELSQDHHPHSFVKVWKFDV
jgi:hypothetical protein